MDPEITPVHSTNMKAIVLIPGIGQRIYQSEDVENVWAYNPGGETGKYNITNSVGALIQIVFFSSQSESYVFLFLWCLFFELFTIDIIFEELLLNFPYDRSF